MKKITPKILLVAAIIAVLIEAITITITFQKEYRHNPEAFKKPVFYNETSIVIGDTLDTPAEFYVTENEQ